MKVIIHFISSFYQMFGHQAGLYCTVANNGDIKLYKNLYSLRASDFLACTVVNCLAHITLPGTTEHMIG
jgi:hypothetical protein